MDVLKLFLTLLILCNFSQGQQNEGSMMTNNTASQTPSAASVILSTISNSSSTTPTPSDLGGSAQSTNSSGAPSTVSSTIHKSTSPGSSISGSRTEISSTIVFVSNKTDNLTTHSTVSSSRPTGNTTATGGATDRSVTPSSESPPDGDTKSGVAAKTTTTHESTRTTARGLTSTRKTPPTPPTQPTSVNQQTLSTQSTARTVKSISVGAVSVTAATDGGGVTAPGQTASPRHTSATRKPSSSESSGYSRRSTVRTRPGHTGKPTSATSSRWTVTSRPTGSARSPSSLDGSPSVSSTPVASVGGRRSSPANAGYVTTPRDIAYSPPRWSTALRRTTTANPRSTSWPFSHYVSWYRPAASSAKPRGTTRHVTTTSYGRPPPIGGTSSSPVVWPAVTGREPYRTGSGTDRRRPVTTSYWLTKTNPGSKPSTGQTIWPTSTTISLGFVTGWGPSTQPSSKTQKDINLLALWICLGLLFGICAAVITACLLRNYMKKMDKWKQVEGAEKKLQDVEMVDFSTNVLYQDNMNYKDRCQDGYPMATQYTENPLFAKDQGQNCDGKQENVEIEYLSY